MKKLLLVLTVALAGCTASRNTVDYSSLDNFEIEDRTGTYFAPADKSHFAKCLSSRDECLAEPMQLEQQLNIKRFQIAIRYSGKKYFLI